MTFMVIRAPRFLFAFSRPLWGGFAVLMLALLAVGCQEVEEPAPGETIYPAAFNPLEQDPIERDSVLALLERLDESAFRSAFDQLESYMFTRYSRTEQFDDENFLVAFDEEQLRYTGPAESRAVTVLASDSSGAFDYGFFRNFVSANASSSDPKNISRYILPEEPSYLIPRNHDAYLYRMRSDTLMMHHVARVIEIRALPEAGDGLNIRRVRLYVERDEEKLVAVQLERIDLAMFFREESAFFMHVQPHEDGTWLPYNTRFQTRIVMPFKQPHVIRTVASFYDFGKV